MATTRREACASGSLDQFFTASKHLKHYAEVIIRTNTGTKVFVDSSCGTGELGVFLYARGYEVHMFDIDDTNLCKGALALIKSDKIKFTCQDWLSVTQLPPSFVLGFNPPFGHKAKLSRQFAEHGRTRGAHTICWLSSYIMGAKGRPWVPVDFARVHLELVPDGAFVSGGKPFSANSSFCIWQRDPKKHQKLLEEWRAEDTRPLPPGWKVFPGRIGTRLGSVRATEVGNFKLNGDELAIRATGADCGGSGIVFRKNKFYWVNYKGVKRRLDKTEKRSVTSHTIVRLPERLRNRPSKVLAAMKPEFDGIRRRNANKRGFSMVDIRKVILLLGRRGGVLDI